MDINSDITETIWQEIDMRGHYQLTGAQVIERFVTVRVFVKWVNNNGLRVFYHRDRLLFVVIASDYRALEQTL